MHDVYGRPNTVYVGRPSKWGNPYYVGYYNGSFTIQTVSESLIFYRQYVETILKEKDPDFLNELRGKNLACWCRLDQKCHSDILLELANKEA
ncbi:DUF4326 domain-containing protein [Candidatus Bathyarchaeota archaeon]|nr:DUF4326 domain-containing protein [Candidatus Bathyarchaeota archaeon]